MDKLQPIIKHHFWIVFVLASILPPVAWWMTTGELAAEIEERTSSLDSTFSGIADGRNTANDDWTNGVNDLIAIRTESNRLALERLWNAQSNLMAWPPNVSKWMETCPYRGEIEDPRTKQVLPDLYKDDYEREVRRVWLIPEPIDDGQTRIDPDLKQKVVFPYQSMPRTPAEKWTLLPPTWQEIWNAQEDLWLLSEVLGAVRRANGSTSSITDSYVKQIMQVQLFGGKRADAPAGGSSASSTRPAFPGGPRGPMTARGGSPLSKPAEFSIGEEYEVANAGGGRGFPGGSGESPGGGNSDSDPQSDENRYIQSEEAYRTRGFKLRVAVHQMQVPNLIRELLNTQYPVEIVRFQQSAINPEEPGKAAGNKAPTFPGASPVAPGNAFAGADSALAGSNEELLFDENSTSDEPSDPDGGSGAGDSLSSKSYSVPAIANVQASLQDRDLVDLVIVGEIYIYNPPAVDESAAETDAQPEVTDAALSTDATTTVPDSTTLEDIEGPAGATPPAVQPADSAVPNPDAPAAGTAPAATPEHPAPGAAETVTQPATDNTATPATDSTDTTTAPPEPADSTLQPDAGEDST